MKYLISVLVGTLFIFSAAAQTSATPQGTAAGPKIIVKELGYADGKLQCKGYIAYDPSIKTVRPAILILPEWWGVTEYTRHRAEMLARLGYVAMVADIYGMGKVATTPTEATELSSRFYQDPSLGKSRVDAALSKLKTVPGVDPKFIGVIGYCFGGGIALNVARMGENVRGTVSFHGGLKGVDAERGKVKGKILVCHGGSDQFVSEAEVKAFRKNLDTTGTTYVFKTYAGAQHAFTNPAATETGKKFKLPISYNEKADKESWEDMKKFFAEVFASGRTEPVKSAKEGKATAK